MYQFDAVYISSTSIVVFYAHAFNGNFMKTFSRTWHTNLRITVSFHVYELREHSQTQKERCLNVVLHILVSKDLYILYIFSNAPYLDFKYIYIKKKLWKKRSQCYFLVDRKLTTDKNSLFCHTAGISIPHFLYTRYPHHPYWRSRSNSRVITCSPSFSRNWRWTLFILSTTKTNIYIYIKHTQNPNKQQQQIINKLKKTTTKNPTQTRYWEPKTLKSFTAISLNDHGLNLSPHTNYPKILFSSNEPQKTRRTCMHMDE